MVQRLVRLSLVLMLVAGCSVRAPGPRAAFEMPPDDPLRDSAAAESLWQSAGDARASGDLAAAARYLERALGMAPDSSWLYRELAELRLYQGDPATAEGLARRALRLAPDRPGYRSALWELIATARDRQGDEAGARRARQEAGLLWDRASGS